MGHVAQATWRPMAAFRFDRLIALADNEGMKAVEGKLSQPAQRVVELKIAFDEGRKAGIKEVVEWFNEEAGTSELRNFYYILRPMWHSKQKEWGCQ